VVNDDELRRRLTILRQKFADGKIVIAEHLAKDFGESFARVRSNADGNVDLTSVDGRVRSMAMMVAMMDDREEAKSAVSLLDIQAAYYSRISSMFSDAYNFMMKHAGNPQSVSWALSRDDKHVEQNYPLIAPFVEDLREFWKAVSDALRYHIQDLNVLKGVFGGDLFPSYTQNLASSVSLYLDTIILTDPFMNTANMFAKWPKQEAVRMFLKHGLQLLGYRDLVLADVGQPIVVILPFESAYDDDYKSSLFEAAGGRALQHAEALFGRNFQDLDDFRDFVSDLSDPISLASILKDPSRLLFDTTWVGDPETQIIRAVKELSFAGAHAGELIFNQCFGRMSQATDISWKSVGLGGVPLIDAPTSWKYYNWMLEYSAAKDSQNGLPLHISRGMQRLSQTDMRWLGNIPPKALIEIRKLNALDDIRAMITGGVEEIITLDPDNFFRSTDKIYDNLEKAFADYQKRVEDLTSKKWKFAGKDIGSWVVAGTIEVAAAIYGNPAWGIAGVAVSQLTDAPKLKDLPKLARGLHGETQTLAKSASGLLFKHRKSST
jgi:hypothetical protein